MDAPRRQHGNKCVKPLCLSLCFAQIRTVGSCKVAEQPLRENSRQLRSLRAVIRCGFLYLKANAAHARIHREVKRGGLPLPAGFFRQCLCTG